MDLRQIISRTGHLFADYYKAKKEQRERDAEEARFKFTEDLEYVAKALKMMDKPNEETPHQGKETPTQP
jgi:hypothetical protein